MACDRGRRGFVRDSATAHIELAWAVDSQCDRLVVSMACLIGFLFIWHPKRVWTFEGEANKTDHHADHGFTRSQIARAWGAVDRLERDRLRNGARRPARI